MVSRNRGFWFWPEGLRLGDYLVYRSLPGNQVTRWPASVPTVLKCGLRLTYSYFVGAGAVGVSVEVEVGVGVGGQRPRLRTTLRRAPAQLPDAQLSNHHPMKQN